MKIEYKKNEISEINYLKAFSIITIVLMHLIQNFSKYSPTFFVKMSSIGGTGVHVFFLLSGLGLYLSYLNKKINYVNFIKKRFNKIFIPYIIIVIISFFVPCVEFEGNRFLALLSHVFLFKMFVPSLENSFGIHFWFISTIIQFYLLAIPIFILKQKTSNKTFLSIGLMISISWWVLCFVFNFTDRILTSCLMQYLWEFFLGIIVADVLYTQKKIEIKNFYLIIIAFLGLSLQYGLAMIGDSLKIFNDIPGMFGYLFIALLIMKINVFRNLVELIGKKSYELYLVHILIFTIIYRFFTPFNMITDIMMIIISFFVAIIFSYLYANLLNKIKVLIKKSFSR